MMIWYPEILVAVLCFFFLYQWRYHKVWPILGMLPEIILNLSQLHDFIAKHLKDFEGTYNFIGPLFTDMNFIATCDPLNVHHVLSKNFVNYHKGPNFREIFDVFGDGIFTADSETWKSSRTLLHSLFKDRNFDMFLEKTIHKKIKGNLLPILDQTQQHGKVLDLQEVFNRFTFDNICSIVLGFDPNSLSIDFPNVACEKAFNDAEESIFYRHIVPTSFWKLQRFLQLGQEKKMTKACKTFDKFLDTCIASKHEELRKCNKIKMTQDYYSDCDDLLTTLMREMHDDEDHKFLRDTAFNLFVAGRDTITSALTWFFWLIATHPLIKDKIIEEIKENFGGKEGNEKMILGVEEVRKLVYLHAALCESLRLFPPIPYERKQAIKSDFLPSGHYVKPGTSFSMHIF
ncbi:putative cytochrome P450 [Lupinus albus]|uniref:Putative cytochrome P450 n=1 Tax=Lupinus albus TaxID=3870 RepID=A0A6A4NDU2_LUPAL|nr:putative cytochrome P450 [Lupinus albus]